jgi:hypothetical protein
MSEEGNGLSFSCAASASPLIMPQIHQHIITIFFYIAVGALSFNRTVSLLSKH